MADIGDRVLITSNCNSNGERGTVINTFRAGYSRRCKYVMVELDTGTKQGYNERSVKIVNGKGVDNNMEGFNNVAIVNLLDDYSKKDYGFALYDSELELFKDIPVGQVLVVVNARGKSNRVLGIVNSVMTVEEYGKGVSAQVVGVVDMNGFNTREEEIKRKAEIKKQKDKIERELETRLRKLESAAFYEKMAKEYADKDPELAKLVEQLKELLGE